MESEAKLEICSDGSELFDDQEFCKAYIEAQSRSYHELFGVFRQACGLIQEALEQGSPTLGLGQRMVGFLAENRPSDG